MTNIGKVVDNMKKIETSKKVNNESTWGGVLVTKYYLSKKYKLLE